MRKSIGIALLFLFAVVAFVAIKYLPHSSTSGLIDEQSEVLSENTLDLQSLEISYEDEDYTIPWSEVSTDNIFLIPNFEEKKTAKGVFLENSCDLLINAGFYKNNDDLSSPIGHFESNETVLSGFQKNSLFNGILSINRLKTPRITRELPKDPLLLAVQTGPIIKENGKSLSLSLVRDKAARRMVAAVTGNNTLIFMSVYDKSSNLNGPYLSSLPDIISKFEKETGVSIADAINLDGGSASALYTDNFGLSEVSPIGSFFCVK